MPATLFVLKSAALWAFIGNIISYITFFLGNIFDKFWFLSCPTEEIKLDYRSKEGKLVPGKENQSCNGDILMYASGCGPLSLFKICSHLYRTFMWIRIRQIEFYMSRGTSHVRICHTLQLTLSTYLEKKIRLKYPFYLVIVSPTLFSFTKKQRHSCTLQ